MDNRSISHTRWKCQYHIAFIPKYRKKVLYGKIRDDVREIISTLCKYKNVEIIAGAVCIDHVHLSVAIPPKLSISKLMRYQKGKITLMIYDRHPELFMLYVDKNGARLIRISDIKDVVANGFGGKTALSFIMKDGRVVQTDINAKKYNIKALQNNLLGNS